MGSIEKSVGLLIVGFGVLVGERVSGKHMIRCVGKLVGFGDVWVGW